MQDGRELGWEVESRRLRILLVNTSDQGGGAEQSVWNLFKEYRARGHDSWMVVRNKRSNHPCVNPIRNEPSRNPWSELCDRAADNVGRYEDRVRGVTRVLNLLNWVSHPSRQYARARGHEDFDFPGTAHLLGLSGSFPDIVHCYNLHEGYFDLRLLPQLCSQRPVILDLRDAWLLSGHCAHSFDCERWKIGCGNCPDLSIYPAIQHDGTAFNWRRKRDIFAKSRVYVAAPSQWLMDKVYHSMLAPAVIESRIIPTGVDLRVFQPAERAKVRNLLNIPQNARVLLFAANGIRKNIWKDYQTLRQSVGLVAQRLRREPLLFIALGENAPAERVGEALLQFVPYQKDENQVASYYQAADLYVHGAKVDNFPRTVLEALACGTPVIASGVGGIPEQVHSLKGRNRGDAALPTGIVVPSGDSQSMADAMEWLLQNDVLRETLGRNAAQDARERFDLQRQADSYLDWYHSIRSIPGSLATSANGEVT